MGVYGENGSRNRKRSALPLAVLLGRHADARAEREAQHATRTKAGRDGDLLHRKVSDCEEIFRSLDLAALHVVGQRHAVFPHELLRKREPRYSETTSDFRHARRGSVLEAPFNVRIDMFL